jgi:alanyl-tRNA synthetase
MTSDEIRKRYIKFFEERGHTKIEPAPLVLKLEDDPTSTTLFISAGMQPLVSYLKGESHPKGKRLVDIQPSLRLQDIEEVGDTSHTTFFEMLGNWSLGDYFKKEQLAWCWEFFTKELKLDPERLYVSVFEGTKDVPKDTESAEVWKSLGVPEERIFYYGVEKNWWSRSGTPEAMPAGEIGGPDSEVFFEFKDVPHDKKYGEKCHPNCSCGRFMEIGNSVFIQYEKKEEGKLKELHQKNVDFGGGLERITAAVNNQPDIFKIDLLWPLIEKISQISGIAYKANEGRFRIIADHIRAAVFLASEGVPAISDDKHGSVLRRLLDGVLEQGRSLSIDKKFLSQLSTIVISIYKNFYNLLDKRAEEIQKTLSLVEDRVQEIIATPSAAMSMFEDLTGSKYNKTFYKNIEDFKDDEIFIDVKKRYEKLFDKQFFNQYIETNRYTSLPSVYAGTVAFDDKTTSGYPATYVEDEARETLSSNFKADEFYKIFNAFNEQHKNISKKAGEKLFKGGLADSSEDVTKLHTTTHLLHAALRKVLGEGVAQKGSNITAERLRFDFSYPEKLTEAEIGKIETLINEAVDKDLPVSFETKTLDEAIAEGALHFFGERYGKEIKVYTVGDPAGDFFSKEVCGGPHVKNTKAIGHVRIIKQEKVGSGILRVYASNKPE